MSTYEKLKKSPEISKSNTGEKIRERFNIFLCNFLCHAGRILAALLVISIIAGVIMNDGKEHTEKHNQLEYEWTTGDSTFVDKIDNIYIYKRYIDGRQFYIYKQTSCCHQIVRETFIPVDGVEKIDSIYFINEDK